MISHKFNVMYSMDNHAADVRLYHGPAFVLCLPTIARKPWSEGHFARVCDENLVSHRAKSLIQPDKEPLVQSS